MTLWSSGGLLLCKCWRQWTKELAFPKDGGSWVVRMIVAPVNVHVHYSFHIMSSKCFFFFLRYDIVKLPYNYEDWDYFFRAAIIRSYFIKSNISTKLASSCYMYSYLANSMLIITMLTLLKQTANYQTDSCHKRSIITCNNWGLIITG